MALFKYLTKEKALAEGFTHKGKLFGIPVFIADIESEAPKIITANFIPEWVLDVAESIYFMIESLVNAYNPSYDPCYKIYITERFGDKKSKEQP
ncbi:hypothetical protein [Mannheimia massilioguelmaensis]|uniref:hypothetical protein n=1 Tax=Mannheimia massilioguelmaensis TaxID=1604354 RepID=UPI0005C8114A|nr:hypothetical protein [Mannheimia massilioguelmaensis]